MTPDLFELRLHACFDERRDPFDDAALCAWLDAHPAQLERVADLRARLQLLPGLAAGAAPRRRRWPLAFAGAAAVAIAVAVARPVAVSAPPPPGRVLSASLVELRPRAFAGVSFTVRQVLAAGPTARLETFDLWSLPR